MEQQTGGRQPQGTRTGRQFVPRSAEFVKESWQELKKVHWPTREETYSATDHRDRRRWSSSRSSWALVDFALSYAMQYIQRVTDAAMTKPPPARSTPRWYVVHTYSGYEAKVKASLDERRRGELAKKRRTCALEAKGDKNDKDLSASPT